MANFQAADLFAGVRRLFVGLQGKKSDGQYEDIKTNDSGALQVSLTGSYVQKPDLVASDIVIPAGQSLTFGDGSNPFTLGTGKTKIATAFVLTSSRRARLTAIFYPNGSNSISVVEYPIWENANQAINGGEAIVAVTAKYRIRLYNTDVSDLTVRFLTLAELS